MGHIVNPVSFRLGVSKYWNSTWAVSNLKNSYSYMANQDIYIQSVFWGLFNRRFGFLGPILKNILPAGIRIVRSYNKIYLFLEFYYVQSLLTKYLLFMYFNRIFNVDNLQQYIEKNRIVLNKTDLHLLKRLKPIFLKWSWLAVVNPIQKKVWSSLKIVLNIIFSKLFYYNNCNIYIKSINDSAITANFIARFIAIRLQQGVNVRRVLSLVKTALTKLISKKVLLGFRIKLSGRFSRIQQASCSISGAGILSRNEVVSDVDYAFRTANLKFSVCGVKVLLARPLNSALNTKSLKSINNTKMHKWFNYIPRSTYPKWQRNNLYRLINKNSKRGKKLSMYSTLNNFN